MTTTKPTTAERLDQARADLQKVGQEIDDIETARATALLTDDDEKAVELDLQLVKLRAQSRVLTDKATLLSGQIEDERRAAAAQLREERIDAFRSKLADADKMASRLQGTIGAMLKLYREVIRLRAEARAALPQGGNPHVNASADAIEGAALSDVAIRGLVAYEFYRISHTPFLGGRPGERREANLPGSTNPDIRRDQPDQVMPLAERLRRASAFAVELIQTVENPTAPEPPPLQAVPPQAALQPPVNETAVSSSPPPAIHGVNLHNVVVPKGRSKSGRTWSELTVEQMRLANGPQNAATEAAYAAVLEELAELSKEAA